MGDGDILKIASGVMATSLEGAGKRFGDLSGAQNHSTQTIHEVEPLKMIEDENVVIGSADKMTGNPAENKIMPKEVATIKENKEIVVEQIDPREKMLKDNVMELRDLYANTDYHERKALNQVNVYFNRILNKKTVETNNVAAVRGMYEKALDELKEYQIGKLKASGKISGGDLQDEVKNLVTYYNCIAPNELYHARTEAKIEDLKKSESGWDKARVKMTEIADFYNKKIPLWAKLTFAATAFAAGSGAIMASKRMLGAVIMSSTGGAQLDALARGKDAVIDTIMSNRIGYNTVEKGEVDFESLTKILNEKISEAGDKMSTQIIRSYVNKAISLVGVSVLGYTAFSGLTSAFTPGISKEDSQAAALLEKARQTHVDDLHVAKIHNVPSTGRFAGEDASVDRPSLPKTFSEISDDAEKSLNGKGLVYDEAANSMTENLSPKSLTIEKGSSIEKTLIDHLKETHPEIKNPGQAAHRMWLDYMHDNKEDIIKKVGDNEYQKMLRDGMVNVKPGTTLMIDEHNPLKFELRNIGGEISHLDPEPVGAVEIIDAKIDNVDVSVPKEDVTPTKIIENVSSEVLNNANHEFAKIETEMQVEGAVNEFDGKIEIKKGEIDAENMRIDKEVGTNEVDADTFNSRNKLISDANELIDIRRETSELLNNLQAEDVPWNGITSVELLLAKDAGSHQILQSSLDKITSGQTFGKLAYWREIKNIPFENVIFKGKDIVNNKGAMALLQEFYKVIGDKALPTKDFSGNPETTRKWLARVTDIALKTKKG